jgi:ATP-dependent RNA helicase DeaD
LFVALGRKDRITPKKLVELIIRRVPLKSKQIGDIQILDKFSFVTVPFDMAEKIVAGFKKKGGKPLFTHAKQSKKDR